MILIPTRDGRQGVESSRMAGCRDSLRMAVDEIAKTCGGRTTFSRGVSDLFTDCPSAPVCPVQLTNNDP